MPQSLYIPGLGGKKSITLQRSLVQGINTFRRRTNHITFFDPRWETGEAYDTKFKRLQNLYEYTGNPAVIWGISAGASLAVSLCVSTGSTAKLNLVCGKVLGSTKIGDHYRQRAPAFVESVESSEACYTQLNPNLCTSYVPKNEADTVIESVDMVVPGSRVVDLPPFRHARAIGYTLLRYLPWA